MADKALLFPSLGVYPRLDQIPFYDPDIIADRYKYLMVDVDHTLAEWDSWEVPEEIATTLIELKHSGRFRKICLVSNMAVPGLWWREQRIQHIGRVVRADHVVRAYWPLTKPHWHPFLQGEILMRAPADAIIMIDDQCRTGILGGNRRRYGTIKVEPMGAYPLWSAWKCRREAEMLRKHGYIE